MVKPEDLTNGMIREERERALSTAGGFSLACACARALNEYGLASGQQVQDARSYIAAAINARHGAKP